LEDELQSIIIQNRDTNNRIFVCGNDLKLTHNVIMGLFQIQTFFKTSLQINRVFGSFNINIYDNLFDESITKFCDNERSINCDYILLVLDINCDNHYYLKQLIDFFGIQILHKTCIIFTNSKFITYTNVNLENIVQTNPDLSDTLYAKYNLFQNVTANSAKINQKDVLIQLINSKIKFYNDFFNTNNFYLDSNSYFIDLYSKLTNDPYYYYKIQNNYTHILVSILKNLNNLPITLENFNIPRISHINNWIRIIRWFRVFFCCLPSQKQHLEPV